ILLRPLRPDIGIDQARKELFHTDSKNSLRVSAPLRVNSPPWRFLLDSVHPGVILATSGP
ncbi:MAG: hypothetical protein ACREIC_34065, partial [Limisphaerales bacterium]